MNVQLSENEQIRIVLETLYRSFRQKNHEGMISVMASDVWIRFLGQSDFRGKELASEFFKQSNDLLEDLDFRITDTIIEAPYAAIIWTETARTKKGDPWENSGVDVYKIENNKILFLHENNDTTVHHRHFPPEK
ncbi:MAG: nuclear transport factor 2 family protein [Acidimicrobiaceae bacterium]|nr:nuclear transport factor 2 family protein [Acidimicrobiaceae bacterium]